MGLHFLGWGRVGRREEEGQIIGMEGDLPGRESMMESCFTDRNSTTTVRASGMVALAWSRIRHWKAMPRDCLPILLLLPRSHKAAPQPSPRSESLATSHVSPIHHLIPLVPYPPHLPNPPPHLSPSQTRSTPPPIAQYLSQPHQPPWLPSQSTANTPPRLVEAWSWTPQFCHSVRPPQQGLFGKRYEYGMYGAMGRLCGMESDFQSL